MFSSKVLITAFAALLFSTSVAYGWSFDGHFIICKIAEARLSNEAAGNVSKLLPNNDFASLCSWADDDEVKKTYPWSKPLHYVDTPDVCNYDYFRDCIDEEGATGRCVVAGINNYTEIIFTYRDTEFPDYNLTEALLFLSNFMGDIHQPLKVGFASDKGGNLINVQWYNKHTNLHHVWSDDIIETALNRFYKSNVSELVKALEYDLKTFWKADINEWERCTWPEQLSCPNEYPSDVIEETCEWAYKGAPPNAILGDDYFYSRYEVVHFRLAQAGVRLAAALNRIFGRPRFVGLQMPMSIV